MDEIDGKDSVEFQWVGCDMGKDKQARAKREGGYGVMIMMMVLTIDSEFLP